MTKSDPLLHALNYIEDLLDQGEVDTACSLCTQLLETYPEDADLLFVYAIALQMKQERKKAIEILEKLTRMTPNSEEVWNHLAMLFFEERDRKKAEKALGISMNIEPQNAFSWWLLSILRNSSGDRQGANRAYLYAQWLEPETYPAKIQRDEETLIKIFSKAITDLSDAEQHYCNALFWNVSSSPQHAHLEQLKVSPLQPIIHLESSTATLHIFQDNIALLQVNEETLIELFTDELYAILHTMQLPTGFA